MTKNDSNNGTSRRRQILDEADWRQRAALPGPSQQAEFDPTTFLNAPWNTLITCTNRERLPCPPGPWSGGLGTINRQEFCSYLYNNGYDDAKEVIDIAERQFAAHFRAPVDPQSLGRLRPIPTAAGYATFQDSRSSHDQGQIGPHDGGSERRAVTPVSRSLPNTQGGYSSEPAVTTKCPGLASQQRSTGSGLPVRPSATDDQPWRAIESVSTVYHYPPEPPKIPEHQRALSPTESDDTPLVSVLIGTPSSGTLSNGTLRSVSPRDAPVSAELQYTIDHFKCYIARQMAAEVLQYNIDEGDQRDDRPGM